MSPILQAERRSWAYWYADGLPHLVSGVGILLVAVLGLAPGDWQRVPWILPIFVIVLIGYAALLLRMRSVLDWLKARLVWPRTGYAAAPFFTEPDATREPVVLTLLASDADRQRTVRARQFRWLMTLVYLGLGTLVALTLLYVQTRWACAAAGVILSGGVRLLGKYDESFSWAILIGMPLVGLWMVNLRVEPRQRLGWFFLGAGLLLTLEGAVTLARFLRRNPVRPA